MGSGLLSRVKGKNRPAISLKESAIEGGGFYCRIPQPLNRREKVSPETRERLLEIADCLNNSPNLHARISKFAFLNPHYAKAFKGIGIMASCCRRAAIIDRFVHHANIFYVNGSTYLLTIEPGGVRYPRDFHGEGAGQRCFPQGVSLGWQNPRRGGYQRRS